MRERRREPHRDQIVLTLLNGRSGGLHGLIDKASNERRSCVDVAGLAIKPSDLTLGESDTEGLQAGRAVKASW